MGKLDIFVIMNLLIHELYINLFSLFWYLYILCNILHAAAKSRQSCPTLCDPIDGGPPGSRPWDSPGKHTGVGCHFLLQCRKVKSESEVAQSCLTLHDPMDCSLPGSSIHWISQARVLEWGAIAFSDSILILHTSPITYLFYISMLNSCIIFLARFCSYHE